MSAAREKQNTEKVLNDMFQSLIISTEENRNELSDSIAKFVNSESEEKDIPVAFFNDIKKTLGEKDAEKRLSALQALNSIALSNPTVDTEPLLVGLTADVSVLAADKKKEVAELARNTLVAIAGSITPVAVKVILPHLTERIAKTNKWTEKVAALQAVSKLVHVARDQIALRMPELIPVLSEAMWDTKKEVKSQAHSTITTATETIDNKDIIKFIPALIKCIADPKEVPETVHLLGATTFVSEVTMATLSIMVPLLSRGLAERETPIKRKAAVIIDNMCKLVDDPQVVAPFLNKLYPALKHNLSTIADPEARNVTERAIKTLQRVALIENDKLPEISTAGDVSVNLAIVDELIKDKKVEAHFRPTIEYIAAISGDLIDERKTEAQTWTEALKPFFLIFIPSGEVDGVIEQLREKAVANIPEGAQFDEEDETGEDLCNCEFSLAYGAKILLNRTQLRLKRNRRYGLCGPNGAGKSTLMRAIAEGQVEGFPNDELKTVYVEHDIDGTHSDTNVVEYVLATAGEETVGPKDEVAKKLHEFGFTDEMVAMPITSLSGGWKMKLALATAVLRKADILLLDEPTNHLDTVNVAWLVNYLNTCGITSIIVSHDTGFLDKVTQYIINYQNFKLHKYIGNLSEFVKKYPPAKSYFELGASEINFDFPEPGFLEGVKTKQKAIVKVSNVSFQYPGTPRPQITDISFQCSLSSRIAVIGPNGAGKSTLINVLTGELIPTSGDVYTHENCRIAYVKQHAFAHIDNHLDKTPSEYIQWRFQTGEDRETMDRASRQVDENDEQAMNKIYKIEGTPRRVAEVLARRKFKNTYEYECSFFLGDNIGLKSERWSKMSSMDNAWIPRTELMESHAKAVAEVDMKEALASGQFRPLVRKEIEEHCELLGLDAELVSHSRIRGLSGGQKVKLVLAACTWQRPHLIVLDEPTNYLDRDSLGALSRAIKKFEGGVVIITHSAEFTKDITDEVWAVLDGKMTPSGHNWVSGQGSGPRIGPKDDEGDKFDALGNKIEAPKKQKKLSASELRKKKKERMKKKKENPDYVSSDDEF